MEVEKRVLNDAFHDKLTGLPNRHFFMGQLETAVRRSRQRGADPFAVIFLDLDRFKVINDSLGHLVGDQLLSAAAARLRACQRPGDTVARFGGDEFVVLLEGLREAEDVLRVATKIQQALIEPFRLGQHEVMTAASIGIALGNPDIKRPEDLLRNADIAMYYGKAQRKGQIQVFNEDMHTRAVRLWQLQNDLSRALEREELRLHYQPIISLTGGRIIGVEALVRWQRTKSEMLGPSQFIPLAEEMGIITDIGEWALRNACAQNAAWQRAGIQRFKVAVNLSPRQLQKERFPETVREILAETDLSPEFLELELTETALMDSLDVAPTTLDTLSKNGIRVAIDDFGTGYSSMSHLRRFAFDTLKIDRSFVADVSTDEKAAAVAKGMIGLAHNLKLKVTAEGVESEAQLRFLVSERCDQIQGFLASQPLEPERITQMMRSGLNLQRLLENRPLPEIPSMIEPPVMVQ
jgi:diguanylate cyclase (GGDEF)-like protein